MVVRVFGRAPIMPREACLLFLSRAVIVNAAVWRFFTRGSPFLENRGNSPPAHLHRRRRPPTDNRGYWRTCVADFFAALSHGWLLALAHSTRPDGKQPPPPHSPRFGARLDFFRASPLNPVEGPTASGSGFTRPERAASPERIRRKDVRKSSFTDFRTRAALPAFRGGPALRSLRQHPRGRERSFQF